MSDGEHFRFYYHRPAKIVKHLKPKRILCSQLEATRSSTSIIEKKPRVSRISNSQQPEVRVNVVLAALTDVFRLGVSK